MSHADLEGQRPAKKRRFFVEEPDRASIADQTFIRKSSGPDEINALPEAVASTSDAAIQATRGAGDDEERADGGFDVGLLSAFVGEELPEWILKRLEDESGNDLQKGNGPQNKDIASWHAHGLLAVNIYLDGSWDPPQSPNPSNNRPAFPARTKRLVVQPDTPLCGTSPLLDPPTRNQSRRLSSIPDTRYLGAFGVTAWATRSGTNLISYDEKISVERTKPVAAQAKLGRGRSVNNKREDVVVRIRNARGEEVGRLEKETSAWISTLLDQNVFVFEGRVVYAPDTLRINDNVYIQLRCLAKKFAFEAGNFIKPQDTNRQINLFESHESEDERKLRLRQVALVKLFDEINIQPTQVNAQTEKHRRQGLLQAAEVAEQYEQQKGSPRTSSVENGGSSPLSDENEEGEELEQDQLDSLYKKAQSFDFNTPEAEPASTFAMALRKYQKQALFWMMGKEKDEKLDHKQQSLHPLWEEYAWPTKDVDNNELPEVANQAHFYVNPYSGELSLNFPVQEQNCLGGILADGGFHASILFF